MKKVLQNWTITSGLQSVSLPCNLNLMLPPHFCTDLNKDIFLAIGKYHSMYRRHICIKHLSKVKTALLVALYWGFVSPNVALKDSQPGTLQSQLIPPKARWDKLPFGIPNLSPLTAMGSNFYPKLIRIRVFSYFSIVSLPICLFI